MLLPLALLLLLLVLLRVLGVMVAVVAVVSEVDVVVVVVVGSECGYGNPTAGRIPPGRMRMECGCVAPVVVVRAVVVVIVGWSARVLLEVRCT
jgi:hypothetical protein